MLRTLKIARLALLPLFFSQCTLLSGKCIYETRSIQGEGRIDDAGTELVSGRVSFSESRDGIVDKFIYWILTGPALKPHVTAAAFRNSSDPTHILLDLPLAAADRTPISEGGTDDKTGANLNGFFDLRAAGHALLELQTDLPDRPTIIIPLTPADRQDWIRPNCS